MTQEELLAAIQRLRELSATHTRWDSPEAYAYREALDDIESLIAGEESE